MAKYKKVGEFVVNSDGFCICDPMHLGGRHNIKAIRKECDNGINTSVAKFSNKKDGLAVVGKTALGKGIYSVYERILVDGSKQIKIDFK